MKKPEFDFATISSRQWKSYAKRLERKNLKQSGKSLSWGSIMDRANKHIVEIHDEWLTVTGNWKATMKEAATNG